MESLARIVAVLAVAGCGDLRGFTGTVPPLVTITATVTGDLDAVRVPGATGERLRLALVWGAQALPEVRCIAPPETPEIEALVEAGCRDPFAFTPDRVAASIPVEAGVPAELSLYELPSADVMVGGVTARVGYASLVVFDDRDDSGTLELPRSRRPPEVRDGPPEPDDPTTADLVYGASFVGMTEPDARLAFREGDFNLGAAFYPRSGCGPPLPAFSIVRAGGFTAEAALAAALAGRLPEQDPATCSELAPDATLVEIPLRPTEQVREVACRQRRRDGTMRYRQPDSDEELDLSSRPWACIPIPDTDVVELVIGSANDDKCRGIYHFTLRGCDDGDTVDCPLPEWDITATPPSWWPCPITPGAR